VRQALAQAFPQAEVNELGRVVHLGDGTEPEAHRGTVLIAAAGTADLPVAEEAAITAKAFGNPVDRLYDVGVAGLHRLLQEPDVLRRAAVIVAVAGMDGALPSVIGGLVACPVIAVPTSTGYGAALGGISALLAMLNSCASGVTVVNIDNGFGAACAATRINRARARVGEP
jgi:NCAIR mutase (PurE)-related protein